MIKEWNVSSVTHDWKSTGSREDGISMIRIMSMEAVSQKIDVLLELTRLRYTYMSGKSTKQLFKSSPGYFLGGARA